MRCGNELSNQSPVLQPSANVYSVTTSSDPGSKFNRVRDIPVGELDQDKLPALLTLQYRAIDDAALALGGLKRIREPFVGFQSRLYDVGSASPRLK